MGKRRRPSWKLERDLRLDIKSCKNNHLSVEELVDHLRSSYHRKYGSLKMQPFTERVQHVLLQLQNPNNDKKPKRMRKSEEEDGGGGESSTLSSMPESHDSSSDREDMLEEEDVDLMQSMLRSTYNQQGVKNNIPNSKKFEVPEMVYDNDDGNRNRKRKNDGMLLKGGQRTIGGEVNKPMFKDIGGIDALLEDLERKVLFPLHNPQVPRHAGVTPIKGVLLHGPPGCGKTTLARAIANETGVPFYQISSTDVVSGISGASEENIRELFSKAYRTAPSIVFIDEIDAIASKRENLHREMERRIVTQLITCMGESHSLVKPSDAKGTTLSEGSNGRTGHVLVIGATNRLDAIDPALRRSGRLEYEIPLGIPDENARAQILSMLTRKLRVEGALDLMKIARSTPGFVGADLKALTLQAYDLVLKRIAGTMKVELSRTLVDGEDAQKWWKKPWAPEELENLNINMADFEEAAKLVQPSTRKEGFSAIPNVTWEDVGGLQSLRQEFDLYIVRRIKYPEYYMGFGAGLEKGFLLYGPPGCGKTLIAKAVANEAGANFIHIKGPEVLNKYVGESELAIRTIFTRARTCSPCILFFDEVDALTAKHGEEGVRVVESVLKQLLIELDGGDERKDVHVIGATNCPEVMNPAILRPGRLGELLYVPLPSPDERGLILKALARKMDMDFNVDLMTIGRDDACKNLSGADLSKLINKAAMVAFKDSLIALDTSAGNPTVTESHFRRALEKISPSVSDKQIKYYQHLSKTLRAS